MRSEIHGSQYAVCTEIWCAPHAANLMRLPIELAGAPTGYSRDCVSTPEAEYDRTEGELGRLRKRLVASIGPDGKSKTGVDLDTTTRQLRERVGQGLPLFRKGEFRGLIPASDQWGDIGKEAMLARGASVAAAARAPKSCPMSGASGRVCMRGSFAVDIDVRASESLQNYEL